MNQDPNAQTSKKEDFVIEDFFNQADTTPLRGHLFF